LGVACVRCGGETVAGQVMPGIGGKGSLGWVDGEPTFWTRLDIVLDRRNLGRARVPAHRCPACRLIFFEHEA